MPNVKQDRTKLFEPAGDGLRVVESVGSDSPVALEAPPVAAGGAATGPSPGPSAPTTLTRKASLNAIASLLDYAAKMGVTLLVTPILVRGLGPSLYGIWEMLGRLGNYIMVSDGRPTEALRLVIAQQQPGSAAGAKRRYVGAALLLWVAALPIMALAGVLIVWLLPALTKATGDLAADVRFAGALLLLNVAIAGLGTVPESVLRGANLAHKRMGFQAALNGLNAVLMIAAVWLGLGLVGLSATQTIRVVLTAICFLLLVRSAVRWFGAERPHRPEVGSLLRMSVWLMAGDVIARIVLSSDLVILGALLGPGVVAMYAVTGYAAKMAVGVHGFAAAAAMPGVGRVLGSQELHRAARARTEMLMLTWLFTTVVGTTILVWNRSFLTLWVGPELYGGAWLNLLLLLVMTQTAFIRVDAYFIDAALQPKLRVLVSAGSAVATIGLGIALTWGFGPLGICVGLLVGRTLQSAAFPVLARRSIGHMDRGARSRIEMVRLALVTLLAFAGGHALGERLIAAGWAIWALGVAGTLPLVAGLALAAGPSPASRAALLRRLRALAPARGSR